MHFLLLILPLTTTAAVDRVRSRSGHSQPGPRRAEGGGEAKLGAEKERGSGGWVGGEQINTVAVPYHKNRNYHMLTTVGINAAFTPYHRTNTAMIMINLYRLL